MISYLSRLTVLSSVMQWAWLTQETTRTKQREREKKESDCTVAIFMIV